MKMFAERIVAGLRISIPLFVPNREDFKSRAVVASLPLWKTFYNFHHSVFY
jgi:hypothetical protein